MAWTTVHVLNSHNPWNCLVLQNKTAFEVWDDHIFETTKHWIFSLATNRKWSLFGCGLTSELVTKQISTIQRVTITSINIHCIQYVVVCGNSVPVCHISLLQGPGLMTAATTTMSMTSKDPPPEEKSRLENGNLEQQQALAAERILKTAEGLDSSLEEWERKAHIVVSLL